MVFKVGIGPADVRCDVNFASGSSGECLTGTAGSMLGFNGLEGGGKGVHHPRFECARDGELKFTPDGAACRGRSSMPSVITGRRRQSGYVVDPTHDRLSCASGLPVERQPSATR